MNLTPQLSLALEACRTVQTGIDQFCYYWIPDHYKEAGVQQQLRQLARLGYLTRVCQTRSGNRVYYRLNPKHS